MYCIGGQKWRALSLTARHAAMQGGKALETATTRAHYGVMTEMESRYSAEDGRKPSRLLMCEFFDNSISALCRELMRKPPDQQKLHPKFPVELHCFYDAPTYEFRHEKLTVRLYTSPHPHPRTRHAATHRRHCAVADDGHRRPWAWHGPR